MQVTDADLPQCNPDDIRKFLEFLAGATGEKEVFTFSVMDKESESVIPGYGVFHGKYHDIAKQIIDIKKATLHVCLNRTNMRGRKTGDMVSCRVLCADLDTPRSIEGIRSIITQYSPGMIVESSEGKYHLYWKIDSSIPLPRWSELQLGLAELLKGDYALAQVTHTIRVPGILRHRSGSPVMPRIVYLDPGHLELSEEAILESFPTIEQDILAAKTTIKEQNKEIRRAVKRYQAGKEAINPNTGTIGRNSYIYHYLKEWSSKATDLTCDDFEVAAWPVNREFSSPLAEMELRTICKKAFKAWAAACEFREEKREERLKSLNVQVTPELITQNGHHVNGETNGKAQTAPTCDSEFQYDYSRPRLKNSRISDSGLVERVVQRFGSNLIRCGTVTYAFAEHTQLWVPQSQKLGTQVVRSMTLKCADDLCADPVLVDMCSDKEGVDPAKVLREQQKWHSHRSINGAVSGVLNEEQIRHELPTIFDSKAHLFYAANGVLNMTTGEIRRATPQDYMLKRSPAVYDPEAKYDWWLEFLDEVFDRNSNKDEELTYLQELFGYALTGSIDEQKIFIHTGEGSNGKSRVISALNALCGDYAARLSSSTLSKSKNAILKEIERIGAKIEGKRAVIIDDLDSKTQWNDGFLKALTDDFILARNLYAEERDIPNRAKIHICCNEIPDPEKGNEALYRRLAILDYNRKFEVNAQKAREIKLGIQENLSGILNWAIEGYQRMCSQDNKIKYPKSVEFRLQVYRDATSDTSNSYEELSKVFTKELAAEMFEMDPDDYGNEVHWHTLEELVEETGASKDALGRILTQNGFKKSKKRKPGVGRPTCYFVQIK